MDADIVHGPHTMQVETDVRMRLPRQWQLDAMLQDQLPINEEADVVAVALRVDVIGPARLGGVWALHDRSFLDQEFGKGVAVGRETQEVARHQSAVIDAEHRRQIARVIGVGLKDQPLGLGQVEVEQQLAASGELAVADLPLAVDRTPG